MKSGKIIRIENDLIIIKIISDNSIIEIHRSNFTFVPNVGDSIEIFKNDDETIVTKMDQESETSNTVSYTHLDVYKRQLTNR